MTVFFKEDIAAQVRITSQYHRAYGRVVILSDVDALIPNIEYGCACLLDILVGVADPIGIVRGAATRNESYSFGGERSCEFNCFD